ncbi:MAG TPA: bifunctional diaminohydroxyphosphoribosylaminopyrimidine deaminase/5-amino-6-(5-phosphoribosylamino)uracil reductase RibD [Candidatus Acidoferrales bacterium]|jgi:diaminohydroxyphosphoribosylaminopyrimidine deaminase/5-amino-6-(5-phosphoribosylamino)uracil reductase|nr:bifunctional diaminohydroxyphosphoribosylaminopyrimidine deaminase/5-amino-6-(5-phosphoribosylamino)uracil reductase RibD [Candidatus Acidoferrales bacterium]
MSTPSSISAPGEADAEWMLRALGLARRGIALTHPNPAVGAVIVKDGRVVGEGFHTYDGRDHAEIVALRQAGERARGATIYVTLEPCCHQGRTGPCTRAIIAAGVSRVVAATADPNPQVAGRGFADLEGAGIGVRSGQAEVDAKTLNEDFAKWIRTGLPFVTLKSALTLDGQIAARPGKPAAISGAQSLEAVQRLRHAADALITGIGTVLADDPLLTDRTAQPRRRPLLRVAIDSRLRLPLKSKLVKSAANDLLVFTTQSPESMKARALAKAGVEIVRTRSRRGRVCLDSVLAELGRREIVNLLIEAGAVLNGAALEAEIVDKMILFYAPKVMGTGGVPMARISSRGFAKAPALGNLKLSSCGSDFVVEGYFRDVYGNHGARRKD